MNSPSNNGTCSCFAFPQWRALITYQNIDRECKSHPFDVANDHKSQKIKEE